MRTFMQVQELTVVKRISEWHCNMCGLAMFLEKESHNDKVYSQHSEAFYHPFNELFKKEHQEMPQHAAKVKVVGHYGSKLVEDCSITTFDLCEPCIIDIMSKFKIEATKTEYYPGVLGDGLGDD